MQTQIVMLFFRGQKYFIKDFVQLIIFFILPTFVLRIQALDLSANSNSDNSAHIKTNQDERHTLYSLRERLSNNVYEVTDL